MIAERGIAGTRVADVAERAGTSASAVIYWFKGKEELLTAALAHEEERFRSQLDERLEGRDAPAQLALLIDASCGGSDWNLWLELWTRALHDPEARRVRLELDQRWRAGIVATVEAGIAAGEFTAADAAEVGVELAAFIDGLAVQVALADPDMPVGRMSSLARGMAERLLECSLPESTNLGSDLFEVAA